MRRLALLIGGTLALWLLLALPSAQKWGTAALVYSATAALLCLIPTTATMIWAGLTSKRSPEQQLAMVLGGTGIRLFGVLLGSVALYKGFDYFREHEGYWAWILVFYLATLAIEVVLMVRGTTDRPVVQPGPVRQAALARDAGPDR